jgi:aerobic-type carbon monoxide dehydrogenase small subunit (CoxS/CutS family)
MKKVVLVINGSTKKQVDPKKVLLISCGGSAIDRAKQSCDRSAQCGACTVVNGKAVRSCSQVMTNGRSDQWPKG